MITMIKDNVKVYAEMNHPDTVTAEELLTASKIAYATGPKSVGVLKMTGTGILITDNGGNASFLTVPPGAAGYNKLLATDANGNLIWVDQ